AGFPQVDVHVDEARRDDQPGAVDRALGGARLRPEAENLAVGQPQVGDRVEVLRRVAHPAVAQEDGGRHAKVCPKLKSRRRNSIFLYTNVPRCHVLRAGGTAETPCGSQGCQFLCVAMLAIMATLWRTKPTKPDIGHLCRLRRPSRVAG